jgi:hypothetical protein
MASARCSIQLAHAKDAAAIGRIRPRVQRDEHTVARAQTPDFIIDGAP